MVPCRIRLSIAWKLQSLPLVVVSESFGRGARQANTAVLSDLLLVNKEEWIWG